MMEQISRMNGIVRKYGFITALKKLTLYIFFACADRLGVPANKKRKEIKKIIYDALGGNYCLVILRLSPFGYNVPLLQRPQHLARSLAKKGCLVFYNVSSYTDGIRYIERLENNLYLINLSNIFARRALMRALKGSRAPKYAEFYCTDRSTSPKDIIRYKERGFEIIYQYVDHISPEIWGGTVIPQNVLKNYGYSMGNSDVFVVATSSALYDDAVSCRGQRRVILSTNGVDAEHFRSLESKDAPADLVPILSLGRPLVCYYGAIASWLDYGLLREIDETNEFSVVLLGANYDGSHHALSGLKNTFYLGHKPYRELKYYAAACDVLMIPFKTGDISRATSPVKLFEYMAIGRPIVCSDMAECRKYKSVLIGRSRGEFISTLRRALHLKNNEEYSRKLIMDADANDWSIKASEIISLLLLGD